MLTNHSVAPSEALGFQVPGDPVDPPFVPGGGTGGHTTGDPSGGVIDPGEFTYKSCVKNADGTGRCAEITSGGGSQSSDECESDNDCNDWVCGQIEIPATSTSLTMTGTVLASSDSMGDNSMGDKSPITVQELPSSHQKETIKGTCVKKFGTGIASCTSNQQCNHTECKTNDETGDPYCSLIPTPGENQCILFDKPNGPVILDGGARDFIGSTDQGGWKFLEQSLKFLNNTAPSSNTGKGVLLLGDTLYFWNQSYKAFQSASAAAGIPESVTTASGDDIDSVNFKDYKIIAVPTTQGQLSDGGTTALSGGISLDDLEKLTTRRCELQKYINEGGALIALSMYPTSDLTTSIPMGGHYNWLAFPDSLKVEEAMNSNLKQTPAVAQAGFKITNADLSLGGPMRSAFTAPEGFNGLDVWATNNVGQNITLGKGAHQGGIGYCMKVTDECAYLYNKCGNAVVDEGEQCDWGTPQGIALNCQNIGDEWKCCNDTCKLENAPSGYCGKEKWVIVGGKDGKGAVFTSDSGKTSFWQNVEVLSSTSNPVEKGDYNDITFGVSPNIAESGMNYRFEAVGNNGIIAISSPLEDSPYWSQISNESFIAKFFGAKEILKVAKNAETYATGNPVWIAVGTDGKLMRAELTNNFDEYQWNLGGYASPWLTTYYPELQCCNPQTGGTALKSIAHNGRLGKDSYWVAVGNNGKISRSFDGETWSSNTSGFPKNDFNDIAYQRISEYDGIWVAVGGSGKIVYSEDDDAFSWKSLDLGAFIFKSVSFSQTGLQGAMPLWVAVGENAKIYTSSDGKSWTKRTPQGISSTTIFDVTHNGLTGSQSLWIATANNGFIGFSQDGISWQFNKILYPNELGAYKEYNGSLKAVIYKPEYCTTK